jgi:CRISPR/Cas system-associated protein Csm6
MTAINMFSGQYLQLASTVNRASANWRLDFRMRQRTGTTNRELMVAMQYASDTFATRILSRVVPIFSGWTSLG